VRKLRAQAVRLQKGKFNRPELDALRFFAFLCVFIHHIPVMNPQWDLLGFVGQFGVSIFFILSAYLLFTILLRERKEHGHIRWGAFAVRRILRIWPLYFAAVGIAFLIGLHWKSVALSPRGLHYLLALSGNILFMRFGWIALPSTIGVLWSVSVEEQFYLVLPLLARFAPKATNVIIVCTIVFGVAYAILLHLQLAGRGWPSAWANSFVQFQFFGAGMLIALHGQYRPPAHRPGVRIGLLVTGIVLWLFVMELPVSLGFLFLLVGSVAIFYSILGVDLHIPQGFIYLGRISYGLYVFHPFWMWAVFASNGTEIHYFSAHRWEGAAVVLTATILTAAISYELMEKPILGLKRRFEVVKTRQA